MDAETVTAVQALHALGYQVYTLPLPNRRLALVSVPTDFAPADLPLLQQGWALVLGGLAPPPGPAAPPEARYAVQDRVLIMDGPGVGQVGTVAYVKYSAQRGATRHWRYEIEREGYKRVLTVDETALAPAPEGA